MTDQFTSFENIYYLEEIWQHFQDDPDSVSPRWRAYFVQYTKDQLVVPVTSVGFEKGRAQLHRKFGPGEQMCSQCGRAGAMSFLQYNVSLLVRNYRVRGHLLAKFNPLGNPRTFLPELDPTYYDLSSEDLDLFFTFGHISGQKSLPLREILQILQETYTELYRRAIHAYRCPARTGMAAAADGIDSKSHQAFQKTAGQNP